MRQYIADAFTDRLFSGNPAAVCIMDEWISDEQMLSIAKENNLSDTAFAVKEGDGYRLRWFTPEAEIDLCGHATLAAGFIIMNYYEPDLSEVRFHTMKDILTVKKTEETSETNAAEGEEKAPGNPAAEKDGKKTENVIYEMDFPAYSLKPAEVTPDITEAVGAEPLEVYIGRDLLCVFSDEEIVRNLQPDPEKLKKLDGLLIHATAKGREYDCVSRSFAPKLGTAEDPVCGSGHCHIIPYWAEKSGKDRLIAYQASERGGTLYCRMEGSRVKLAGKAVLYSTAEIQTEPGDI